MAELIDLTRIHIKFYLIWIYQIIPDYILSKHHTEKVNRFSYQQVVHYRRLLFFFVATPVIPSYLLIRNYFCRETTSEVFRLRSQLEDSKDHIDSLKRENKNLSLEVKDLLDQIGEGGRSLHEVERQKRRLECEKEELANALDEAESALEAEENRVVRAQFELATLRYDLRLIGIFFLIWKNIACTLM